MGTNYYWIKDACDKCGRGDDSIHIGKSSFGWTFNFHGTDEIRSWKEWREALAGQKIEDECGRTITLDELATLVHAKLSGINHARIVLGRNLTDADRKYMVDYPTDMLVRYSGLRFLGDSWLDDEGHGFSGGEFS